MIPIEFRDQLRRAVLTILVAPDPDARFLRQRSAWPFPIVQHAMDAYGAVPERMRLVSPTPADLSYADRVADWLSWLRREHGQKSLNLVIVWALGTPLWRVAQRQHVTQRTVHNRVNAVLQRLYAYSRGVALDASVQLAGEVGSELGHTTFMNSGAGSLSVASVAPGKVWVSDPYGGHWTINGKTWRDGTEKL